MDVSLPPRIEDRDGGRRGAFRERRARAHGRDGECHRHRRRSDGHRRRRRRRRRRRSLDDRDLADRSRPDGADGARCFGGCGGADAGLAATMTARVDDDNGIPPPQKPNFSES